METEFFGRLSQDSRDSRAKYSLVSSDSIKHLSEEKKTAWAQMLLSVSTVEATEETLMEPLVSRFKNNKAVKEYFSQHAKDEYVHAEAIKKYVWKTFKTEKRKKTFADIIFYECLFKLFRGVAGVRPLPFVSALLFYETYSHHFYHVLQKAALNDGLHGLHQLISQIAKDELRHRAGLKAILNEWDELSGPKSRIDYWLSKILINTVKADINTSDKSPYNRRVKKNMTLLGLGPQKLYESAQKAADESLLAIYRIIYR